MAGCPRVLGWAPVPGPAGWGGMAGTGGGWVKPGAGLAGGPRRWSGRVTMASRVGSSGFVAGRG